MIIRSISLLTANVSSAIPYQNILHSSTRQAEQINHIEHYFFIAAGFVLLLVIGLTSYILIRFRESKAADKRIMPGKIWELPMLIFPTALVALFLYLSITTMSDINPDAGDKVPDVVITAHQWWWQATYPGDIEAANEIHLPAGKPLLLKLVTADVVHDWWIPQFGNKMDIIPMQDNYLWLTIKEPGEYYGTCSEFCGLQHANMRIKVIAETQVKFDEWLERNKQPVSANTNNTIGANLFTAKTCGDCHRIEGTSAKGNTGPDLTHIGSRTTLLAGMSINNNDNLKRWLKSPQYVKPGAYMPDFLLPDSSIDRLTDYLLSLK
jgi:cytochrome c oxidase subunit 2